MKIKVAFLTTRNDKGDPQIGDCIVITFDEKFDDEQRKACIVIDGGYSTNDIVLKEYLVNEQINVIDLIVATHIDNDHISGLKSFLNDYVKEKNQFELRNYWGPAPKTFDKPISVIEFLSYIEDVDDFGIEELSFISQSVKTNGELYDTVKDIISEDHIFHPSVNVRDSISRIFNSIELDVLAPDKQIPDESIVGRGSEEVSLSNILIADSEIDLKDNDLISKFNAAALENNRTANNQSIVLRMIPLDNNGNRIENCSFLFTGDAERDSWEFMIPKWGNELKSELLKVSHHGSRTGTFNEVLKTVNPNYCVICSGTSRHGIPDEDVLKMIDKENIGLFCTGRDIKMGKGSCTQTEIMKKCPRWDHINKKHIINPQIFELNTDTQSIVPSEKPCEFNWKYYSG